MLANGIQRVFITVKAQAGDGRGHDFGDLRIVVDAVARVYIGVDLGLSRPSPIAPGTLSPRHRCAPAVERSSIAGAADNRFCAAVR
jgi:hypothetical protein